MWWFGDEPPLPQPNRNYLRGGWRGGGGAEDMPHQRRQIAVPSRDLAAKRHAHLADVWVPKLGLQNTTTSAGPMYVGSSVKSPSQVRTPIGRQRQFK